MLFGSSPDVVAAAICDQFSEPPYAQVRGGRSTSEVSASVQPGRCASPIRISIEIAQEGDTTRVMARTTSQWQVIDSVRRDHHECILRALEGIANRLGEGVALRQLY